MTLADRLRTTSTRFVRDFSWVGAGQLARIAARLAGIRLLTELIEPSEFGIVGLTVGLAILARNVLCAPILEASWRFYADALRADRMAEHRALLGRLLRWRTSLAMAALILGGGVWSFFAETEAGAWTFIAVAVLTAFETVRLFEVGLLNAARRHASYVSWVVMDEVLRFGCAIAAVLFFGAEALWVIVGYAVGVGVGAVLFWRVRVRGEGAPGDLEWMEHSGKQVASYAVPLSLLAIVGWVFGFSDRYILATFAGTEATGIYVAAYGLASQPFIVTAGIFNLSFRPVYNDAAVRGDRNRERQAFLSWLLLVVGVLAGGAVLMTLLAEPLTKLLLAESYAGAASLLPWLGAAYALQGWKQVFEAVVYAAKRTWILFLIQVVSATVAVGLYLGLIPGLGALGAALGTVGGMTTGLIGMIVLSGAVPRFLGRGDPPGGRSGS